MLKERVTGLEGHANCPLKDHLVPFDKGDKKTILNTTIGDIVHIAHQYPTVAMGLCDDFFENVYPEIFGRRNNIMKEQTHNIINSAMDWIKEYEKKEKYFEVKTSMMIAGMIVTGSYDCLVIEADGMFHLIDYKTTSNAGFFKNWIEKKQVMFYAFFIMKQYNLEKIKVSYQLYIKGKDNTKVRSKRITKIFFLNGVEKDCKDEYIDNIAEKVIKVVEDKKMSMELDYHRPKPRNEDGSYLSSCFYCPMRNEKYAEEAGLPVCPMKKDSATIDFT